MTWQLATAKIYNGSTWVNAAGGANIYQATDGVDAPYTIATVTATASATPNTKGAWIEVIASTPITSDRVIIVMGSNNANGVNTSCLVDIGTGAAGAETVIASNLGCGNTTGFSYDIPLRIVSGTRIAARIQSATGSRTQTVGIALGRGAKTLTVAPSTTVTTWGSDTTKSRGVTIVPGLNVKGNWTQITANSGNACQWIAIGIQNDGQTAAQGTQHILDIGVGAAGSETVIVPNIRCTTSTSEIIALVSLFRTYFVDIPASSRIVVRSQAGATTAAYYIDVMLFGGQQAGSL